MFFAKALISLLIGFSLCIASITGIVIKDTIGTIPVSGAIVKLEISGLMDTTGSDGLFSLGGVSIIPSQTTPICKQLLTASMRNGNLTIQLKKASIVMVTVYNLQGKYLCNQAQMLDAGSHSIVFPHIGAGIHLYNVKSGTDEIVMQGHSFGTPTGKPSFKKTFSENVLSKQAIVNINDFIIVRKNNYLNFRQIVTNPDTSGIVLRMICQDAGTVTDIDGNVYTAKRFGNQIWTVSNFKAKRFNDGVPILHMPDSSSWYMNSSAPYQFPVYCVNTTSEFQLIYFGLLYNGFAAQNPKIAPPGWHLPSKTEWDTLKNYLITNGYNYDGATTENKIAKSMASNSSYWDTSSIQGAVGNNLSQNNSSGFNAYPGGMRSLKGEFFSQYTEAMWWTSSIDTSFKYEKYYHKFWIGKNTFSLVNTFTHENGGLSIRFVKN